MFQKVIINGKFQKKLLLILRSDGPDNDEMELAETGNLILQGGNTESTMVNPNPDGSSSGQGEAELVVSTISREIRLGSLVGKGKSKKILKENWSIASKSEVPNQILLGSETCVENPSQRFLISRSEFSIENPDSGF